MDQIVMCLGGRKVVQEEAMDGEMSPQPVATGSTSFSLVIEGNTTMNISEKTRAILMFALVGKCEIRRVTEYSAYTSKIWS